jgi:hypothetical protein
MRARYFLLIAALFGGLVTTPASAINSEVKSVDAPLIYYYADQASGPSLTTIKNPRSYSVDKEAPKSTFVVDYTNTPQAYHEAIQAAVDIWSNHFSSKVPVKVEVIWERQANVGTLAAASPGKFHTNFRNIPDKDLWYASALADALSGEDIEPTIPEVTIRINSTNGPMLYLGTDGNCPSTKYDLETMILHEMAHGLGFLSNADYDDLFGYGSIQQPTPFDAYAQLPDGRRLMDLDSPSLALGNALAQPLVWSGANALKANNGVRPPLYTPSPYENGSSISHLDEATFENSQLDALMSPNLKMAEVFHDPGPLLIAMIEDLLTKPPIGIPSGVPGVPRNVKALVGDRSVIVTFDPPVNQRTSQISSYAVTANQTGKVKVVTSSPAVITGLENGMTYSFSVTAKNAIGVSSEASTDFVVPQSTWKRSVIDSSADGKYLATATYAGKTVIAYSDSKRGLLKLATWSGKKWSIQIIDGDSSKDGRTKNSVAGNVSICTNKVGKVSYLNLYYADLTDKDLRRASFNGKKWSFETIDGNGPAIQNYKEVDRVRTASDVSASNACAISAAGEQVFYRDESQGILLGAVRDGRSWRYEIVDGDNTTNGRTTGDVAFHLRASVQGSRVSVLYDSVLSVSNADKSPLRGEVRVASRESAFPEDWKYENSPVAVGNTIVAGYDVALNSSGKDLNASWFGASGISLPKPDQVQWNQLGTSTTPSSSKSESFGAPNSPIAVDSTGILFGCQERLCNLNKADQKITLVSGSKVTESKSVAWITINKIRYALVASGGKLTLFKRV